MSTSRRTFRVGLRASGVDSRVRRTDSARSESGESLAELIVTIAILGLAIVGILGAIGTSLITSDAADKQALVQTALRSYAEGVAAAPYTSCATNYSPSVSVPAGVTVQITEVAYGQAGTATSFSSTCGTDAGYQRVSLRAFSTNGRAEQRLQIVKRKP